MDMPKQEDSCRFCGQSEQGSGFAAVDLGYERVVSAYECAEQADLIAKETPRDKTASVGFALSVLPMRVCRVR